MSLRIQLLLLTGSYSKMTRFHRRLSKAFDRIRPDVRLMVGRGTPDGILVVFPDEVSLWGKPAAQELGNTLPWDIPILPVVLSGKTAKSESATPSFFHRRPNILAPEFIRGGELSTRKMSDLCGAILAAVESRTIAPKKRSPFRRRRKEWNEERFWDDIDEIAVAVSRAHESSFKSLLRAAGLQGKSLAGTVWRDVSFDGDDLSNLDFQGAKFIRCSFRHTNLAGTKLSLENLTKVTPPLSLSQLQQLDTRSARPPHYERLLINLSNLLTYDEARQQVTKAEFALLLRQWHDYLEERHHPKFAAQVMGEELGVTQRTWSRWRIGSSMPNAANLHGVLAKMKATLLAHGPGH